MSLFQQSSRFLIVGLGNNVAVYLAYLLLTSLGTGHKTAMTVTFICGVTTTYFINRNWTFRSDADVSATFRRYVTTYVFCYAANWFILLVAVDHLGLPHEYVQASAVVALAGVMFLLHRYWVFSPHQAAHS